MRDPVFEIRNGTEQDAPLAAWIAHTAIGLPGEPSPRLQRVCAERDTLYSWEHLRVVTADGLPVGGLIAYPGAEYARLRAKTWPRCWDEDPAELAAVEQECGPGAFYLDSMALRPEYRGHGLGRRLLRDAVAIGRALGYRDITLIADKGHPRVVRYYEDAGFRTFGSLSFFGHDYWKMRFGEEPPFNLTIKTFSELTTEELYEILRTREAVFIVEQNCPYPEADGRDYGAVHLFSRNGDGRVNAYLRLYGKPGEEGTVQVGRVVTTERGAGLGRKILQAGMRYAIRQMGARALYLEAQVYAVGFYAKEGFEICSPEFLEDGIPHVQMRRKV